MRFYMTAVTNDLQRIITRSVDHLRTMRQREAFAQRMSNELQRPVMLQNATAKRITASTSTMNHGLFSPKVRK